MNSGTYQAGVFILAFVIYTTMKGNLRRYLEVVGIVDGGSGSSPGEIVGSAFGRAFGDLL